MLVSLPNFQGLSFHAFASITLPPQIAGNTVQMKQVGWKCCSSIANTYEPDPTPMSASVIFSIMTRSYREYFLFFHSKAYYSSHFTIATHWELLPKCLNLCFFHSCPYLPVHSHYDNIRNCFLNVITSSLTGHKVLHLYQGLLWWVHQIRDNGISFSLIWNHVAEIVASPKSSLICIRHPKSEIFMPVIKRYARCCLVRWIYRDNPVLHSSMVTWSRTDLRIIVISSRKLSGWDECYSGNKAVISFSPHISGRTCQHCLGSLCFPCRIGEMVLNVLMAVEW